MTSDVVSTDAAATAYVDAEQRLLDRHGLQAQRRTVEIPSIDGHASVLTAGSGPPVMLIVGGGPPVGIWVPLMAQLTGFSLHAVELPGLGLTSSASFTARTHRRTAVSFLEDLMAGVDVDTAVFAAQSIGSLWSFWLALDRPDRVRALSALGCPAAMLRASAPLPLRFASVPGLGELLQRLDPPSPAQVDRFIRMAGERFTDQDELRALFLAVERLPDYPRSLLDLVRATVRLRGARPEVALTGSQLAAVHQPVQLIWGADDPFGPPTVGELATQHLPDAELHVVPGGHGFWVRDPARIAGLMEPFLAAHSAVAR